MIPLKWNTRIASDCLVVHCLFDGPGKKFTRMDFIELDRTQPRALMRRILRLQTRVLKQAGIVKPRDILKFVEMTPDFYIFDIAGVEMTCKVDRERYPDIKQAREAGRTLILTLLKMTSEDK
jgi:hypothetical protein